MRGERFYLDITPCSDELTVGGKVLCEDLTINAFSSLICYCYDTTKLDVS